MSMLVAVAGTAAFQVWLRQTPFELQRHQLLGCCSRLGNEDWYAVGYKQLHSPLANASDDNRLHALLREPLGERSWNMLGSLLVRLADNVASGEVGIDDAEVRGSSEMIGERCTLHGKRNSSLTCDWTRYCLHIEHKPITVARLQIKSDFLSNPCRGVI